MPMVRSSVSVFSFFCPEALHSASHVLKTNQSLNRVEDSSHQQISPLSRALIKDSCRKAP